MFSELCAEAEVTHKRMTIASMYRANLVIIRVLPANILHWRGIVRRRVLQRLSAKGRAR